jgi:hypothetical protein
VKKYTPEEAIAVFWSRVDNSAGDDACWLWTGSKSRKGYGDMGWRGRVRKTHRIAYEITHGEFPAEMQVLHSCDNPRCVNPAHLWLGTNQDNMDDMNRKGRGRFPSGEQHGNHKLTDQQVAEIRARYANGETNKTKLGAEYGVTRANIYRIVQRIGRT